MNDHLSNDRLVDFVHGELSPSDDALVHAHLAGCVLCREGYEVEATLSEALRSAAKAEELEMPSLVAATVWERVRNAKPGPMARVAGWLRPVYALPVAAALLVGGFFVSPLAHRSGPTIEATYYLQAHAAQAAQTPLSERSSALVLETSMVVAPSSSALVDGIADGYATTGAVDDVR
ncbi:MAG: zf-HC2 domain-containing protein [Candidatus Eremiobacteraeota bacterium]|nr:zf-HC2 domain-containing protein [Candidatus Eremiobacteraeota bacterium]